MTPLDAGPDAAPVTVRPGLRLRARYYPFSGTKLTAGYYTKLVYGLLALTLMFYSAVSTYGVDPSGKHPGQPPTAWYLQWLIGESESQVIGGHDEFPGADARESSGADGLFQESPSEPSPVANLPSLDRADAEALGGPWGTGAEGRDTWLWIGRGAESYLTMGLLAALIAVIGGVCFVLISEWPIRPQLPAPHIPGRIQRLTKAAVDNVVRSVDSVPKFMLLLAVYGIMSFYREMFAIGLGVVVLFGNVHTLKDRLRTYLASEAYLNALEIGHSSSHILVRYVVWRQFLPLALALLPHVMATFILYETTLAYFGFALEPMHSWGQLAIRNQSTWGWAYWLPVTCIIVAISGLYLLGDALRERIGRDE